MAPFSPIILTNEQEFERILFYSIACQVKENIFHIGSQNKGEVFQPKNILGNLLCEAKILLKFEKIMSWKIIF